MSKASTNSGKDDYALLTSASTDEKKQFQQALSSNPNAKLSRSVLGELHQIAEQAHLQQIAKDPKFQDLSGKLINTILDGLPAAGTENQPPQKQSDSKQL